MKSPKRLRLQGILLPAIAGGSAADEPQRYYSLDFEQSINKFCILQKNVDIQRGRCYYS
jgi:hypothetical protein